MAPDSSRSAELSKKIFSRLQAVLLINSEANLNSSTLEIGHLEDIADLRRALIEQREAAEGFELDVEGAAAAAEGDTGHVYGLELFGFVAVPVICAVGLFGNLLAFALIQRNGPKISGLITHIYLRFLAIVSSVFLAVHFLTWILALPKTWNFYAETLIGCKLITFLGNGADLTSMWLIVVISLDRMLLVIGSSVGRPGGSHQRRRTPFRAKLICLVVAGMGLALSSWPLVYAVPETLIGPDNNITFCGTRPEFIHVHHWLNGLETTVSVVLPSCLVVAANAVLVMKLIEFKKAMKQGILLETSSAIGGCESHQNYNTSTTLITREFKLVLSPKSKPNTPKRIRALDVDLTLALIITSTGFVLLNLPSYLSRLFLNVESNTLFTHMIWYCSYLLYYLHHAVVFYLYSFNSTTIRRLVKPSFRAMAKSCREFAFQKHTFIGGGDRGVVGGNHHIQQKVVD